MCLNTHIQILLWYHSLDREIYSLYRHPHKEGNRRTYAYQPRSGIVQNVTKTDERKVERQTNGHSSDSSNMEFINKMCVVCVRKK
jgi:hypothetical protein